MTSVEDKLTPMMEQWHACKKSAKDSLLLFRMGDFYEAFYEDAQVIADALDLTLTQRQKIPMSGVPWHTADAYVDRLVAQGYRVAIAEQMENPLHAKGIVKREVVRIVTPGTHVSDSLVAKSNQYLSSITQVGVVFALASCDLSTGEFKTIEIEEKRECLNELLRLAPKEIITGARFRDKHPDLFESLNAFFHPLIVVQPDWHFDHKMAHAALSEHFKLPHLDAFGLKGMVGAINAAGALLSYLKDELSHPTSHINVISPYSLTDTLSIDQTSQKNLELTEALHEGKTLIDIIDDTKTAMGGRMLRQWLTHPLLSVEKIRKRQAAVASFVKQNDLIFSLRASLGKIRDLERLMMKVTASYATPKDLVALRLSLEEIAPLKLLLEQLEAPLIAETKEELTELTSLIALLKTHLVDDPPLRLGEGNLFRTGVDALLDELKEIASSSKNWIAHYQAKLKETTGIKTLKVSYNKIFGYYIEVSRGQSHLMPSHFERRQTLINAERFISPELREYESKVLGAEEKIASLETTLFKKLLQETSGYAKQVFSIAKAVAVIDALHSLGKIATDNGYCAPVVDEGEVIEIVAGRHPIVERSLASLFIPNDALLGEEDSRMIVVTGPNMGGKSTFLRQVAMITLLAQIGSFVPAKRARIGVVDKIFTRIGANDDLGRGQSTFMVEMSETASILHNATARSLIILDEIGRGTSTYDGVAIASAVAEYLLSHPHKNAKTLFATHYFELTSLEGSFKGAKNANVAIEEREEDIVFLHKIVAGAADRSYGIHVARLAGLPSPVIARAKEIVLKLESTTGQKNKIALSRAKKRGKEKQLFLFDIEEESDFLESVGEELKKIKVETISPLDALQLLAKWKKRIDAF